MKRFPHSTSSVKWLKPSVRVTEASWYPFWAFSIGGDICHVTRCIFLLLKTDRVDYFTCRCPSTIRSPEIILGLTFNSAIDIWSLGIIMGKPEYVVQYHNKFISPHTLTYEILLMTRQASLILWLKEQSGKNKNPNVRLRHSGSVLTFWCLAGTMFTTFTIRACLRSTKPTVQLHQALGFLWCFVVVFCLQLRFMVDLLGDPPRRLLKGGLHTALFYCGDHKYLIFKRWTL